MSLSDFILTNFKIQPRNQELYKRALTHRSYLNESKEKNLSSYERQEFLGDAVLSVCISEILFHKFPQYPEGDLTNFRSTIVKTETLAAISKEIGLGKYLRLSKGEDESGGRNNPSILADCLEALLAAIFLDQGISKVKEIILLLFGKMLADKNISSHLKDAKSLLQEISQEKFRNSPVYKVISEKGPDHQKVFLIEVFINQKSYALGKGLSKQKAEEEAAKLALEKITK